MRSVAAVILFLFLSPSFGSAQITFNKHHNFSNIGEKGFDVIEVKDGYVFSGFGNETTFNERWVIRLVKTDFEGNIIWNKVYGDTLYDYIIEKGLIKYDDGGFILTGIRRLVTPINRDGIIIRTDSLGNEIFRKSFGGVNDDQFFNGTIDSQGNIYAIGETFSFGDPNNGDLYVVKTDSMGNLLYETTFGGQNIDKGLDIIEFNDTILLGGYTKSFGGASFQSYYIKVNDTLGEVYNRVFGWPETDCGIYFTKYIGNNEERLFISSCSDTITNGIVDASYYIAEINDSAEILWQRYFYDQPKHFLESRARFIVDTFVYFSGWIYPDELNNDKKVGWILKYTLDGELIFDRRYTINKDNSSFGLSGAEVRGLAATSDGGVIATGVVFDNSSDYWLLKLDSTGCIEDYCGLTDTSCYYQPFPCDSTDAIETVEGITFNIYPNPASNQLTIEYDFKNYNEEVELIIYSLLGKKEKQVVLNNQAGKITLSTNDLISGVYLYNIRTNKGQTLGRGKLVVVD